MRCWGIAATLVLAACGGGEVKPDPIRDAGRDGGVLSDALPVDAEIRDAGPTTPDAAIADAGFQDSGVQPPGPCDPLEVGATDRERFDAILLCLRASDPDEATKRAAIEAFVLAIESSDGFPIATTEGAIFVYVRTARFDAEDDRLSAEDFTPSRRNEPIAVAGEFNMWIPRDLVMTSEGFDFFHFAVAVDTTAFPRARYKFVATDDAGNDVWFSDPLSRRFDYDPNGRISIVRGGSTQGHLEWLRDVHATMLGVDRTIYVYVPPGYDAETGERYAVLYMHDGNNLFNARQPNSAPVSWEADQVFEREYAANAVRAGIIVGIPNNPNRFGEYTHVQDDFGEGLVGGDGDLYAHFVAEELKPLIDNRYRTSSDRQNTGVLGSSLGGLVSFQIGRLYPNVFSFVGGMSSTFFWGRFGANGPNMLEVYEAATDLASSNQIFYLDSGGGPGPGCTSGGGSDNYCETLEMRQILIDAGVNVFVDDPEAVPLTPMDANLYHWWDANAPHSESAWNARVHRPFRFFFRR